MSDTPLTVQAIERTRAYLHNQCESEEYEPVRVMIDKVCDAAIRSSDLERQLAEARALLDRVLKLRTDQRDFGDFVRDFRQLCADIDAARRKP